MAATSKITNLHMWWDQLTKEGPNFGYFPNPSKTWLVTKKGCHDAETSAFADTGVNITSEGRPYLGAAIGSEEFVENYVKLKVSSWHSILLKLATIAMTQPHAAYSALTHGVLSKWIYLSCTVPNIGHLLKPLDDALQTNVIPGLTEKPPPNDLERALFALPARMGGLGITIPSKQADQEHRSSFIKSNRPPPRPNHFARRVL